MPSIPRADPALRLSALLALTHLVFAAWPGIDLWASALFWDDGFQLARSGLLEAVRVAIRWASIALFLAALAAMPLALARRRPAVPARVWAVIAGLYLLAPGLLVNGVLKSWWGRARPADIVQFGGTRTFTPPVQIADQCASNCSFVSGEGAGAAAMAIAVLLLAPAIPAPRRRPIVAAVACAGGIAAALRVATGRHFLSDTVFAILLVGLVAAVLWRWLPAGWHPWCALQRAGRG